LTASCTAFSLTEGEGGGGEGGSGGSESKYVPGVGFVPNTFLPPHFSGTPDKVLEAKITSDLVRPWLAKNLCSTLSLNAAPFLPPTKTHSLLGPRRGGGQSSVSKVAASSKPLARPASSRDGPLPTQNPQNPHAFSAKPPNQKAGGKGKEKANEKKSSPSSNFFLFKGVTPVDQVTKPLTKPSIPRAPLPGLSGPSGLSSSSPTSPSTSSPSKRARHFTGPEVSTSSSPTTRVLSYVNPSTPGPGSKN
jgi:hypothetical protein